jgi:Flp pilus assembly protein TadB
VSDSSGEDRKTEDVPDKAPGKTPEKATEKTSDRKPSSSASAKRADRRASRARADSTGPGVVNAIRGAVASVVWTVAVLAALVLAVGALLIALGFNTDHLLVEFVIDTALRIDLGELKAFDGESDDARTKWVLVNWGIAALAYLIVGKLLDRLIRP